MLSRITDAIPNNRSIVQHIFLQSNVALLEFSNVIDLRILFIEIVMKLCLMRVNPEPMFCLTFVDSIMQLLCAKAHIPRDPEKSYTFSYQP